MSIFRKKLKIILRILRLEDAKGNGANLTKPCNWRSANEAKQ